MDAHARSKAIFRAKLNAQKKEKRIDSPLVRYNEFDQPVCRVCDVVLKSESQWDAHQVSRKHREAISKFKANAAGRTQVNNAKPVPSTESPKSKADIATDLHNAKLETTTKVTKPQPSPVLPPDFYDNPETKRPKAGADSVRSLDPDSHKRFGMPTQTHAVESLSEKKIDGLRKDTGIQSKNIQLSRELTQTSTPIPGSETKQVKGVPEGFFDNKEADLRARGIKPVKPDVKDEYKEFEKLIQEDLQEVDDRLEEEEIDAAEMIEEAESVEQKAYREKVEFLKKKRMELMTSRPAKRSRDSEGTDREASNEDSSSDEDEDFAVDWRAQHL